MKVIKFVYFTSLLFIFLTGNISAGTIITKVKKVGMSGSGRILVTTGSPYKSNCSSTTLGLPHVDNFKNFDQMYSLLLLAHATDKGVRFILSNTTCIDGMFPQINFLEIQP